MPKKYTVVGYYESTNEPAVFHVEASDESRAVANIKGPINGSDYIVVAIFRGHLQDLNECALTSAACDWKR